ncbi:MAG TPA: carboxypeptidase-like regulatory domain-containing protein [Candidatus Limnocylindria bacterium]|nr:carboxypeptidase-like regulatory domain-containing protein [Candidatus Limnocylindria bacterium]
MHSASNIQRIRAALNLLAVLSLVAVVFRLDAIRAQPAQQSTNQQRIPGQAPKQMSALEGVVHDPTGRAIVGAHIILRNLTSVAHQEKLTNAEGVFRLIDLQPGTYELKVSSEGYTEFVEASLELRSGEVLVREIKLAPLPATSAPPPNIPELPQMKTAAPLAGPEPVQGKYPEAVQRPDTAPAAPATPPQLLPPADQVFRPEPDRWLITMPDWDRYGTGGEHPYVKGRWWDPFDQNKLKGDVPIFGQRTFFILTGLSDTFFDLRRLPVPSDVSTARPGSSEFFGKGGQGFLDQVFLFSFDLFHGDTSFRPVDWRIRVTPAVSLNYLDVRELGIVNIDVRAGTTRLDSHFGLQEAFAEVKIHDLSPNYDFISVRAGIQGFNSDFRGFIFVDEQPGIRLFGNLKSNLYQYNVAYFNFLEKNTNSGLNSFALRNQQVIIANLYRQDFFFKGYTAQFSFHYNKDDATIHFDDNGFLVRPAPVGAVVSNNMVQPHSIRAAYLGWTGDGHIGRINLTHAFYQALGDDSLNGIAGRRVTINAQMAALELSVDKDWARFKSSVFYSSGSANPRGGRARGFDAIEDFPEFAGGIFSLWNREGIRLTGAGVTLTPPNSLLPSLRSNKDEGQANFVNPGIFLANAGANFDLTPKLRSFVNVNYLRFERTEPLELLLFQSPIHHTIGVDSSIGVRYRPPLTENISITGGAAALVPGQGFRDIYGSKTLFSVFTDIRFQF